MKKKWIAIIGSPRRKQNTEMLTDLIIKGLKHKDIEVKKLYLDSKRMSLCTDCEFCISSGYCSIDDELSEIINEIRSTDGIILAAPSYNYNVSAQMKVFLDRTFCLNDYENGWKPRLEPGRKAIIVGVCKGRTKDSMGYTIEAMRKSIDELGVQVVDTIEYYNTKDLPVEINLEIEEEIVTRIINNKMI